jgi:hypothetical protein
MSGYDHPELTALDQVEDLLVAYADARLTPAGPVLARMRAVVVAEAAVRAAAADDRRRLALDARAGARWTLSSLHVPRRAFAFGMAATLTLGTTAAVLAAPPGSPFYGARVAVEAAFLPSNADARLVSHEDHLNQRLAEAQAAAASGDSVALGAALAAYQAEVDAAVADLGDDPDRLAHLEEALGKHVAVLQALEATLPSDAAIEHAIDVSQKAVDKLKAQGTGGGKPSQAPHATRPPKPDPNDGQGNPNP